MQWIGQSIKRVEDSRLLTGKGSYVDDLRIPNLHHAAILRSPHGHARILGISSAEALKQPGVVAVLTGEDVAAMARPFPTGVATEVHYYPLAVGSARFVGEPVAVVVARTRYEAEDALDSIEVDYEPLPVVTDPEEATGESAPLLHDYAGTNIANHRLLTYGDLEQAFSQADQVVRERFVFPKYASTPMETYAVAAHHNPIDGTFTVWSNFHGPFIMHPVVAKALKVPETKLRFIVPPDIGGAFGIKVSIYPYIALLALAAKKAGVAVKWIEDRREHLLASSSGADRVSYLEAAVKQDGTILGMRGRIYDNVGGYLRTPEPGCLYRPTGNFVGAYNFKNLQLDNYAVMTNKSLTGPNRGYGCQQLYFGLERLIDRVARTLKRDPVEVRMRNFIRPEEFPYTTPTGGIYDSGDYPAAMRKAVELARYEELKKERQAARRAGRLFGIGVATAVDPSVTNMAYITLALEPEVRARKGFLSKSGSSESATIKIDPLGKVNITLSTTPQGQGHETVVGQIVADELGVSFEDVRVTTQMDTFTNLWSITSGAYSSRFAAAGASAFALSARKLKEKVKEIAAHLLEAHGADLEIENGTIRVVGSPEKSMPVKQVAGIVHWSPHLLPRGLEPNLTATATFNFPNATAPDQQDRVDSSNTYGFIAEIVAVEIDPETCEVKIVRYASVHDAGRILNPLIVEGQIIGSIVHGIGGALYEELAYDDNAQLMAATFMDYLCPTVDEVPKFDLDHLESPSPFSILGAKGCGESSSMVAPAVIANAVEDALWHRGVRITTLPLSPNRVWHLLQAARRQG
ncbi:MAG: xanthine dehydrogenase family protein molybdopterin-binding subunit [Candidatus Tectomicrobia bacterium]|nr:xanthine dehydrogenase family protein molybdopterin-binding subunit [Candidatus Tectomicrobia bacterium]